MKTNIQKSIYLFLISISFVISSNAQQSGKVSFPEYGLEFTIPAGWVGQTMEEVFVIGHQSTPGFMMVSAHDAKSKEELAANARQGMADAANGIYMQQSGSLEDIGSSGLGSEFTGSMGGQQVKAYIIGLINPHGVGVSVMTAVSPQFWNASYKDLAKQLASSIRFSKVVAPPVQGQGGSVAEWKNRLGNTKLTHMESYSSYDYSNPNITTGGGYNNKEVIDICSKGYFNYYSSNFMSVTGGSDAVSGNAYSSGNNQGQGRWEIRAESNGNKILVLKFHNGEVYEYTLSYPENKMHLNGRRFYHTWTGENAPNCY